MAEMNAVRPNKLKWLAAAGVLAALVAAGALLLAPGGQRPSSDASTPAVETVVLEKGLEAEIAAFCGDCHKMPRPISFPRAAWHDKVSKGYEYYSMSGRTDLTVPPLARTVAYYRSQAPEQLDFPEPPESAAPLGVRFGVEKRPLNTDVNLLPAVSGIKRIGFSAGSRLAVSDMRNGRIVTLDPDNAAETPQLLTRLQNPCRVEPCDLDGDGALDLLVADLGSMSAADHDQGKVVWMRRRSEAESFEMVVLAEKLGRVADVRAADFDGDDRLDVLVCEFGHYRTGQIFLLRNVAGSRESLRADRQILDERPGTIELPVGDLDGDGDWDFVALISQEYEEVDVFLNDGAGHFTSVQIWSAPDLTFGSSGLDLVDLDQDGDLDLLFTNGDAFDNMYVNPSHGVQWLENRGKLQFVYHRLADMLGAYRARPCDVDGDGDLDILVSAWLPEQLLPPEAAARPQPSILCLEQTAPRVFVRHTLETGFPYYPTLEVGDFDDDGDCDFAVGPHVSYMITPPQWLAIWWNEPS